MGSYLNLVDIGKPTHHHHHHHAQKDKPQKEKRKENAHAGVVGSDGQTAAAAAGAVFGTRRKTYITVVQLDNYSTVKLKANITTTTTTTTANNSSSSAQLSSEM